MGRHQAKFEGKIIKKSYGLDALGRFSENEKIEFNCFFEGNIDLEPIEIGGKVFIPGFNEYVVVTEMNGRIRLIRSLKQSKTKKALKEPFKSKRNLKKNGNSVLDKRIIVSLNKMK